ncbi:MAG TPA: hypothetical protein VGC77_10130 [Rhodopseudomonas sp.]|uniref:hypothetical protein n=1 Tax=Rhodopseudomonas sp. TaxID=1078 RepID=UPI002ED8F1D8
MALIHLPIYPLAIALVSQTGLPLRIASELVFLIAAISFAVAWGRLAVPRWAQLLAFAAIAFHPYSIDLFDCTFAENFYAILMLLAGGQFVRVIAYRNGRDLALNAALFAIFLALAWHTRKEAGPLLGGFLALSFAGIVAVWLLRRVDFAAAWRLTAALVIAPAVLVVALGAVLISISGARFGLWATNELTAPNYVRAFTKLQQIDAPSPRFVPVSQAAREKAYQVSPAFAELRPFLEDSPAAKWARHEGEMFAGTSDLYAGYFYWLLRDAVNAKGYYSSAPQAEAFYGRIADEMEQAFHAGTVKARRVPLSFIDPNLSAWLPYLPASLYNVSTLLFAAHLSQCAADSVLPPNIIALYDRIANRRAPPPQDNSAVATIEGWLSSSGSPIKSFDLVGHDLIAVKAKTELRREAGVGLQQDNPQPALAFKIEWPFRQGLTPYGFRIERENGTLQLTPGLEHVPLNNPILLNAGENDLIQMNISKLQEPPTTTEWRTTAAQWIFAHYNATLKWSCWLALACFLAAAVLVRRWPLSPVLSLALGAMLALVASRVLLFAILDASAWSGMQPRYLFPVGCIAAALPFIVLGDLSRLLRTGVARLRRSPQ